MLSSYPCLTLSHHALACMMGGGEGQRLPPSALTSPSATCFNVSDLYNQVDSKAGLVGLPCALLSGDGTGRLAWFLLEHLSLLVWSEASWASWVWGSLESVDGGRDTQTPLFVLRFSPLAPHMTSPHRGAGRYNQKVPPFLSGCLKIPPRNPPPILATLT